ncbi:transient receptor potential cation channel, subfamily M isoform X1 [Bombus vancouverensis nearcticus]|uniref:Transient receptor potential cation channel trpm isoform X1 n=1 Tax=Bombus bifarius TaxID=103933 RepID=A0A6P8NA77_9HYME|nr:transient receptor potential cation channel trpm isoform X1 [Bombus vancouverensis nearcticus]XP_033317988.1 transient receptor potential cation channel trpm isoform X1 [Bombus bifarius]
MHIRIKMAMGSIICGANTPKMKRKKAKVTERSWIEATFQKRECSKFIPSADDEHKFMQVKGDKNAEYDVITTSRCCCGYSYTHHCRAGIDVQSYTPSNTKEEDREQWSPGKNTRPFPTDAYGTIEFQGGPHPTKAQYVRLAYDTRPEPIVQLLCREWNLGLPKLLITVHGGRSNFELQPTLKKVLRKGLLKAAKTTGAWIFTGGTNTGVTRQVGDALLLERSQRQGRVVSIGIAPWGILDKSHELVGRGGEVPYECLSSPWSKYAVLNNRHAYFLLVDNGTGGRYGAEIVLRRRLEKYISNLKLQPYTHSSIPVVALVIEGGTNTIRSVLEYVTDVPPVPVVVCDGSGRAADLIAFMHKYASEGDGENGENEGPLESMRGHLLDTIKRTFKVSSEQASQLYSELLQCTRKKHLITVFRISQERPQELDQTILTALFKSKQLSPAEQLSLSLIWNRVDIARCEIFVYGQNWPSGALEQAMMQALQHDRIDFVKLLLENGVSMRKFLSIPRLEELYNTKEGPSNTLGYILRDVRPNIPRGYMYTLHDIGLVINKLMGGAYRSQYTRRRFRMIYTKVMKRSGAHPQHMHRNSCVLGSTSRYYSGSGSKQDSLTMSLLAETLPANRDTPLFDYPFNELLIWAVLTKRQQMALLMWQHGEEALAKALVALKLYKAMAHEAAEDDLETEVYDELRSYGKEFENIALELLDYCYRQDDDQTKQLLTSELQNWSGQTCLSLAVTANHRPLLAHPCSQIILADLWMGGLRTRKNTNLKVVLGLVCPFYIMCLEFKSREELQLMPQTQEEHLISLEDEKEDSDSEHGIPTGPDVEKRQRRSLSVRNKSSSQQGAKLSSRKTSIYSVSESVPALISNEHTTVIKETIVQENGKVLTDNDDGIHRTYGINSDYYDIKNSRPLRLRKKLYEFYTAPITKFWANAIAYIIFLVLFSYSILIHMDDRPSLAEIYAIAYICTLGCEKVREIATSEPATLSHKFSVWAWNMWNPCDAAAIIFFQIGLALRLRHSTLDIGRVIYCVDSIYWYLRILNILGVNKYFGPLVTMMGKMVKNMTYFVVLLIVVLMSFGVTRQAILNPNAEPKLRIIRDIFMEPYFMLYGEVYADNIDPDCGDEPGMIPCLPGRWITPTVMSIYLLIANILLINLLIAVFNNIFNEVNAVAHQVWMFQRFTVVMEYEQKPVLPPPLIVVCHIYLVVKYLLRYVTQGKANTGETYDNGLKLFLEADDMERLYDFEEDCVEGYFREQELKLQMSTEERVKITTERVENMHSKIEDIDKKENTQNASLQAVEFRMRKLEELNEQILAHLGVIHRFMAIHMPNMEGLSSFDIDGRQRRVSERSEVLSETDSHTQLPAIAIKRKRLVRSMTDGTFLNLGPSIDDDVLKHSETAISRENLSRNESSISGDGHTVQDDIKTITSQETEASKVDGEGEILKKDSHSDSRELSREPSREPSGEPSSKETSTEPSRQTSRELSRETSREATSKEPSREASSEAPASEPIPRQDSTERPIRQNSRTRSESDDVTIFPPSNISRGVTWAEPRVAVIPSSSTSSTQRSILLAMHAEYTSITDELESYCGLLSPPRTPPISPPPSRARNLSEMSNPEMAWQIENEHLRDAEECDYQQMEDLIQRRYIADDEEPLHTDEATFFISNEHRHQLRRASAIDEESRRPPPTICVTREIEQTLSRPPIRDSESSDPNDKNLSTVPAPASETMC